MITNAEYQISKHLKLALIAGVAMCLAVLLVFIAIAGAAEDRGNTISAPDSPSSASQSIESAAFKVESFPSVPSQPSQQDLAAIPLAYYDSVIPELLAQGEVSPEETWKTARPLTPLVALYPRLGSTSEPVAAIASITVEDVTKLAVFGVYGAENTDGGWLLVGTPSRKSLPSAGSPAPAVTFAYARAADFELLDTDRKIVVDTATGLVQLISKDGTVLHSETGTLGSPDDPTPVGWGYVTATYTGGTENASSAGKSIALISAHSSANAAYGSNNALTAIHYSTSTRPTSFGCVRVSVAFTKLLENQVGIAVIMK